MKSDSIRSITTKFILKNLAEMKVLVLACLALLPLVYGHDVPTGVWDVDVKNEGVRTITPTQVLHGYGTFKIVKSDNQKIFPSREGWFKATGGYRGKYFYFAYTMSGKLKVIYFGPFSGTYKSLPNYYGREIFATRKDYLKQMIGSWNVAYKWPTVTNRYVYTITCTQVLGDNWSPYDIVMSDNQRQFPSKDGWYKGANGKRDTYLYFKLNKNGTVRIIYFGPYSGGYKYKGLKGYYGVEGIGSKDLIPSFLPLGNCCPQNMHPRKA